ncbi:hypothetical protein FHT44_005071 [Mycolicibacterium sp. BK634]|uniref:hypothetical protein n=1 Tax=Mycolicibacterium sp. BK634 TaxID=2587099 RepID=UPI0016116513|nr:hypothetical protein [Mycolicibacterium sp. BK634]MBB3752559.1 hypothetical protein [Mycolicibacterium sp. BK634]
MNRFGGQALRPDPSMEGRDDLPEDVEVYAHHSSSHDGLNIEIDAPAGVHITVHINDGMALEMVVPE